MLSVWPTSFAIRLPDLGSHIRMTRSGDPAAMTEPYGSVVSAYTEALAPAPSGVCRVIKGSFRCDAEARSQSLMVRSNEPEANHCCSRLHNVSRGVIRGRTGSPVRQAANVVGVGSDYCGLVEGGALAMGVWRPSLDRPVGRGSYN